MVSQATPNTWKASTNALRFSGIEWNNEIRFRRYLQHSLGVFIKAGRHGVGFSKDGEETGQGRIAVRELLADIIAKLGSLRLGGHAIESECGLHQFRCEWVIDFVLEVSKLVFIQCRLPHARWNRRLHVRDLVLVRIRFLCGPFPQHLRSFFGITVIIDSDPPIERSDEEVEECRR